MYYSADLSATLQSIPWFMDLDTGQLNRLVKITELREIQRGELLFSEGSKDDNIYIVLEGKFSLEIFVPTRGNIKIFTAEPLDIIGWSGLTPVVRQRTATARALTCSRVTAIQAKALSDLCDEDHDIGYVVMRRIANVIASRLLTTRLQLLDIIVHSSADTNPDKSLQPKGSTK